MLQRTIQRLFGLALAMAVLAMTQFASAADWGTIKGRIIYKGAAPAPAKIKADKDVHVCGKHPLVDESLVVGKAGELANVFVYLNTKTKVAVHPDYAKTAKTSVVLDNKGCRYQPHAAVMVTSQPLLLKNSDAVAHNVKGDLFKNAAFNVLIPPKGEVLKDDLTKPESRPCPIGCNIHPWMSAKLLVRDDPYAAVTGADGAFEIKNIPAGSHEFQLWQEKPGYLDGAKVQGKAAKKGRFTVNVKAGVLDLGDITIDAALFQGK
jgi:hypothetical protein